MENLKVGSVVKINGENHVVIYMWTNDTVFFTLSHDKSITKQFWDTDMTIVGKLSLIPKLIGIMHSEVKNFVE